ncbi:MAG: hypothetical protein ACRC5H_10440 [Treponemataceae bacterium]
MLSAIFKDLINIGQMFLYSIENSKVENAEYYLSTDSMFYYLSHNGVIIEKIPIKPDDIVFSNRILFINLPITNTLKNINISWAC